MDAVSLPIYKNKITAFIGPSGCGKSTVLRAINRMNDLIPGARVEGEINYHGKNLYNRDVDPVEVRRRIGMVFQKPNPFPKTIYDNVAFGPRINGAKGRMDQIVETSLRRAALWDEVKDKLDQSGLALSGGQQQRRRRRHDGQDDGEQLVVHARLSTAARCGARTSSCRAARSSPTRSISRSASSAAICARKSSGACQWAHRS